MNGVEKEPAWPIMHGVQRDRMIEGKRVDARVMERMRGDVQLSLADTANR
jgi:hypothetical protein